jgi:hypothetical protein
MDKDLIRRTLIGLCICFLMAVCGQIIVHNIESRGIDEVELLESIFN